MSTHICTSCMHWSTENGGCIHPEVLDVEDFNATGNIPPERGYPLTDEDRALAEEITAWRRSAPSHSDLGAVNLADSDCPGWLIGDEDEGDPDNDDRSSLGCDGIICATTEGYQALTKPAYYCATHAGQELYLYGSLIKCFEVAAKHFKCPCDEVSIVPSPAAQDELQ